MSHGLGRLSNGNTSVAVEAVHRILWLISTIGALVSLVIAYKGLGQPDPMIGLAICSVLAPYVAARSWDELLRDSEDPTKR